MKEGRVQIRADSEALIVKGIVAVIVDLLHDRTPEEICESALDFMERTPIRSQVSVDRFHGMQKVIEKIRTFAKRQIRNPGILGCRNNFCLCLEEGRVILFSEELQGRVTCAGQQMSGWREFPTGGTARERVSVDSVNRSFACDDSGADSIVWMEEASYLIFNYIFL